MYQTSEGLYLAVGALEKKFWEKLCDAVNRKDLKKFHWTNKNMKSTYARNELEKIFLEHSQKFWVDFFEQFDCCVTPVLSLDRALEDEQIKARDMVLNSEHPLTGATLQFSSPASISDFHTTVDHPAPKQGEHTQQILSELGYSPDNISDLGDTVKTA